MPAIDDNGIKVAITMEKQQPLLLKLNQSEPLAAVIKGVCKQWNLAEPDDYALRFDEDGKKGYITERNRTEIRVGNVLKLALSVSKTAEVLLETLSINLNEADQLDALRSLCDVSQDITFAQEFISRSGHEKIIQLVEGGTYTDEFFILLLQASAQLMESGILNWNVFGEKFIKNVASVVNKFSMPNIDLLECALELLESIVLHSSGQYALIINEIKGSSLVKQIEGGKPKIQKNTIALINAMFLRGDDINRKFLADLQFSSLRSVILNSVIRSKHNIGQEMEHQLYVLQCVMFGHLEVKRNTRVELNDQNALKEITNLRRVAFDNEPDNSSRKQSHAKDYSRLGFSHPVNPLEDFHTTPPGVLALDNMVHFAKQHSEDYTKVVLENSCKADEHDCPFAKASICLTNMLCDILKIGDTPCDEGQDFYPMFFTTDKPFEEFFCVCVQLLNKTWKEMKATSHDFTKVMSVVEEQLNRALVSKPKTYEELRNKLATLTYSDITALWQQERRNQEENESQVRPIVELREKVEGEIMQLIKQQRLTHLVEGTLFRKYSKGAIVKGKFWYCRLSPNHKVFHYGDCEEDKRPAIEQLLQKLSVVDIKSVVIGKDCPHIRDMKERDRAKKIPFAFSIIPDSDLADPLNFMAGNLVEYSKWVDGINALIGNPMTSEQMHQDLEMLLGMDIKLRLLDTEGVTIPDSPPPIPKEPPNYDFVY